MQSDSVAALPSGDHVLLVGQDRAGRWVVQETDGFVGGLFVNRDAALHFARAERRRFGDARVEVVTALLRSPLAA